MNYGRKKIYTDASAITIENVVDEVAKAYATHCVNQNDISLLWDYYRGKTKIRNKEKEVRAEINHKINENRAFEIVGFHKGYVFGEPIQYVRRENATSKLSDDAIAADINALNGYMSDANKASCDNSIAEWLYIAGVGYRLTRRTSVGRQMARNPRSRCFRSIRAGRLLYIPTTSERRPLWVYVA